MYVVVLGINIKERFIKKIITVPLIGRKNGKNNNNSVIGVSAGARLTTSKRLAKFNKWISKHSFFVTNMVLVVVVTNIVFIGHDRAGTAPIVILSNQSTATEQSAPLDAISSADIAASIAKVGSLPEAVAVSNQADSVGAQVKTANVDQAVVIKPQIVVGGAKTKAEIASYTTKEGDTVATLATQFGVTSDSIKWSNGLTSDNLSPEKTLQIPPRNGIIYKVADGDTIDSIATKYNASKEQLVVFNDYDVNTLNPGETILIPDGIKPADPVPTPRPASTTTNRPTTTTSTGSSVSSSFSPVYGVNGYVHGYCTYYAAARAGVPSNWGNANTWDNYARASGWIVSSVPRAGAVFQTDSGWAGHVGIVEEVYGDGTMLISDMNGIAGYNRVGYARVPQSAYPNYIYR